MAFTEQAGTDGFVFTRDVANPRKGAYIAAQGVAT
jgi:hypothetical protein